jgi:cobyrinic acid a,c-diamide synthase
MVSGYLNFEPNTPIAGVILNHVGNPRHERTITRAIEQHCGIPVLGAIPRDDRLAIRERHLGIVPLQEQAEAATMIDRIGSAVKQYVDIKRVLSIAGGSRSSTCSSGSKNNPVIARSAATKQSCPARVKIGILADRAFSFYYPENLEALQRNGAQLVYIDSFTDKHLPAIDALYIGGGFPELYAAELEANINLRHDIRASAESGLPVYAECAGLIYLCRSILTKGSSYEMVGLIPADVVIEKKPQGHGYVSAEVACINPFFPMGTRLRGHEFHHSRLLNYAGQSCAYRMIRGNGIDGKNDGVVYKNVLASYMHLHALGAPAWATNFVKLATAGNKTEKSITVKTGGK